MPIGDEHVSIRRSALERAEAFAAVAVVVLSMQAIVAGDRATSAADAARQPPRPERTVAARAEVAKRLRAAYERAPSHWPPPQIDEGAAWEEIGLLPPVVHPDANPFGEAKAELGRMLFFDPRLSKDRKTACASCHVPRLGWAHGEAVSRPGGRLPGRNTPTIRNVAHQTSLFWDGRAKSLEAQAEQALTDASEMAADRADIERWLAGMPEYRRRFEEAFPGRGIEFAAAIDAIACFERTVVSGRSRFDDFLRGESSALSDREILGLDLFRREGRCMHCHHGPLFSDGRFHNLGLSFYGRSNEDLGRHVVTGDAADVGCFRTPSLRDVTQTAPLMHTGTFELPGVLRMYNAGMATLRRRPWQANDERFPVKSPHLRPLGLIAQDLEDLAAFLGALEEPLPMDEFPVLPQPDDAGGPGVTARP